LKFNLTFSNFKLIDFELESSDGKGKKLTISAEINIKNVGTKKKIGK